MKDLEVGQSCEVVKVLSYGGYGIYDLFKIGGWTIGSVYSETLVECLSNGKNNQGYRQLVAMSSSYKSPFGAEVKPVGRLTVTKVK